MATSWLRWLLFLVLVLSLFLPTPAPPPTRAASRTLYFPDTGFSVGEPFADYFQRRGGVRSFGFPISRPFRLQGALAQLFQRGVLQLEQGAVSPVNLLDPAMFPITRWNGLQFPPVDERLLRAAPAPDQPDYAAAVLGFIERRVPDLWNGLPVNFQRTYLGSVTLAEAFPDGGGDPALLPLLALEVWGLPTSSPAFDPHNRNFIYQRFQRGILHYDRATGLTQGVLIGDAFKAVITGEHLPDDLAADFATSPYFRQYAAGRPRAIARPGELADSDLTDAFATEPPPGPRPIAAEPESLVLRTEDLPPGFGSGTGTRVELDADDAESYQISFDRDVPPAPGSGEPELIFNLVVRADDPDLGHLRFLEVAARAPPNWTHSPTTPRLGDEAAAYSTVTTERGTTVSGHVVFFRYQNVVAMVIALGAEGSAMEEWAVRLAGVLEARLRALAPPAATRNPAVPASNPQPSPDLLPPLYLRALDAIDSDRMLALYDVRTPQEALELRAWIELRAPLGLRTRHDDVRVVEVDRDGERARVRFRYTRRYGDRDLGEARGVLRAVQVAGGWLIEPPLRRNVGAAHVRETEHFIVRWYDWDRDEIDELLQVAEEAIAGPIADFGVDAGRKIELRITPIRSETPTWEREAAFDPGTRRMFVLSPTAWAVPHDEDLRRWLGPIFAHEYTHAIQERLTEGRGQGWLIEGSAVWQERRFAQDPSPAELFLRQAVSGGRLIPLTDLERQSAFTTDSPATNLAYAESEAAVEYLVRERGGFEKVRELHERWGAARSLDQAVEQTYGISLAQLSEEALAWMRAQYGGRP